MEAREALDIHWMAQWWKGQPSTRKEWNDLKEAIPPAYTEWLGVQVMDRLG
jgi:hypothetical protein